MAALCCTYHQLKYSSNHSKNEQEPHKRVPFGKWRFRENEVGRMGPEQKRIRKGNLTRQKNKRGDAEKWDQTGTLEIPDRVGTTEIPGLPSGGCEPKVRSSIGWWLNVWMYVPMGILYSGPFLSFVSFNHFSFYTCFWISPFM